MVSVMLLSHGRMCISHVFVINAGVRQGGVLSPLPFSVYMDNLIDKLEACGYGCKVHGVYVGCIAYYIVCR